MFQQTCMTLFKKSNILSHNQAVICLWYVRGTMNKKAIVVLTLMYPCGLPSGRFIYIVTIFGFNVITCSPKALMVYYIMKTINLCTLWATSSQSIKENQGEVCYLKKTLLESVKSIRKDNHSTAVDGPCLMEKYRNHFQSKTLSHYLTVFRHSPVIPHVIVYPVEYPLKAVRMIWRVWKR